MDISHTRRRVKSYTFTWIWSGFRSILPFILIFIILPHFAEYFSSCSMLIQQYLKELLKVFYWQIFYVRNNNNLQFSNKNEIILNKKTTAYIYQGQCYFRVEGWEWRHFSVANLPNKLCSMNRKCMYMAAKLKQVYNHFSGQFTTWLHRIYSEIFCKEQNQ